jgi:hypothetical protein
VESEGPGKGAKFTARFKIDVSASGKAATQTNVPSAANIDWSAPSVSGGSGHAGIFCNVGNESKQANHALA